MAQNNEENVENSSNSTPVCATEDRQQSTSRCQAGAQKNSEAAAECRTAVNIRPPSGSQASPSTAKDSDSVKKESEQEPETLVTLYEEAMGNLVKTCERMREIGSSSSASTPAEEGELKNFGSLQAIQKECEEVNSAVKSYYRFLRETYACTGLFRSEDMPVAAAADNVGRCYAVELEGSTTVALKPPFSQDASVGPALPIGLPTRLLLLRWQVIIHALSALVAADYFSRFGLGTVIAEWTWKLLSVACCSDYPNWILPCMVMVAQSQFALKSYYNYTTNERAGFKATKELLLQARAEGLPDPATRLKWPRKKDFLKVSVSMIGFCAIARNQGHLWSALAAVALLLEEERKEVEVLKCVQDGYNLLYRLGNRIPQKMNTFITAVIALKYFRLRYTCRRWQNKLLCSSWGDLDIKQLFEDTNQVFEAFQNILDLNAPMWVTENFKAETLQTALPCLMAVESSGSVEIKEKCIQVLSRFIMDDFLRIPHGKETDDDDLSVKLVAHCVFNCLALELKGPIAIERKRKRTAFFAIRVYSALLIRRLSRHGDSFYRSLQFILQHVDYIKNLAMDLFEIRKLKLRTLLFILPALEEKLNFENQVEKMKDSSNAPYTELINAKLYLQVYEDLRKDALRKPKEYTKKVLQGFQTSNTTVNSSEYSVKSRLESPEVNILKNKVNRDSQSELLSEQKKLRSQPRNKAFLNDEMEKLTITTESGGAAVDANASTWSTARVDEDQTVPATSDPAASDPAASDPAASDPAASDPAASDPAASDPAASDPAASDPAASDPAASDPAASAPAAETRDSLFPCENPWNFETESRCPINIEFPDKQCDEEMTILGKMPPLDAHEEDLKQMGCAFPVTLSSVKTFLVHAFAQTQPRIEPDLLHRFRRALYETLEQTLQSHQWAQFKWSFKCNRVEFEKHLQSKLKNQTEDIEELVDILHKSKIFMRFYLGQYKTL